MRLFVGIAIPQDVLERVRAFVDSLRSRADLKWAPIDDLHITTKFIGEQPPERIATIERALAAVKARPPFRLVLRGVGWFPNEQAPRIFWAGVERSPELAALVADTERLLAPLGVAAEERAYSPHATLARMRKGTDLTALRAALIGAGDADFGAFAVDRFMLYESRQTDRVSRYNPIATFPLANPSC